MKRPLTGEDLRLYSAHRYLKKHLLASIVFSSIAGTPVQSVYWGIEGLGAQRTAVFDTFTALMHIMMSLIPGYISGMFCPCFGIPMQTLRKRCL